MSQTPDVIEKVRRALGRTEPLTAARDHAWASDDNIIPTFSYAYAVTRDMSGTGWWTIREVTMPHWALVALLAMTPGAWLLSWRRQGIDAETPETSLETVTRDG